MRKMVTGASPIQSDILDLLKVILCCDIHEGWGLTETAAPSTITDVKDPFSGHVGGPMANVEIKLVDIPEMNYLHTNKPNPQGEVCVRGHNVFTEYLKRPKMTKEVLTDDGWFSTGDVGEILPNGALKIIDRKKNIFKLAQGEYIAPEKLENIYNKSLFVSQIFIDGDSHKSYIVGIVVIDEAHCANWAKAQGLDPNDLIHNEVLKRNLGRL